MALALFFNCERSSAQATIKPVGRCRICTAESVVFTPCPPGPDERENRQRSSDSGTTTFSYALLGTVTGEGSAGWSATALVEGRLAGSEGTADVTLTLTSPDGTAIWTGSALLASAPDSSGFDLTGSYTLAGAPVAMAGLPTFGGLSGRLALAGGSLARLFLGLA